MSSSQQQQQQQPPVSDFIAKLRFEQGLCPFCGNGLYKVSLTSTPENQKELEPLTIEGLVRNGRCLFCYPDTAAAAVADVSVDNSSVPNDSSTEFTTSSTTAVEDTTTDLQPATEQPEPQPDPPVRSLQEVPPVAAVNPTTESVGQRNEPAPDADSYHRDNQNNRHNSPLLKERPKAIPNRVKRPREEKSEGPTQRQKENRKQPPARSSNVARGAVSAINREPDRSHATSFTTSISTTNNKRSKKASSTIHRAKISPRGRISERPIIFKNANQDIEKHRRQQPDAAGRALLSGKNSQEDSEDDRKPAADNSSKNKLPKKTIVIPRFRKVVAAEEEEEYKFVVDKKERATTKSPKNDTEDETFILGPTEDLTGKAEVTIYDGEGVEYTGHVLLGNTRKGFCYVTHRHTDTGGAGDVSIYKGEFAKGLFHGKGKQKSYEGSFYNGEFASGFAHGKGTCKWDGWIYEGEWKKDCRSGYGVRVQLGVENGEEYRGEWLDDQWNVRDWAKNLLCVCGAAVQQLNT